MLLDRKAEHRLTWEAAIATQQERIKELEQQCRTNHSMEIDSLARKCDDQASEISRLKGVIAICKRGFETIHDGNRYGSINAMNCRIALAAIKEAGL